MSSGDKWRVSKKTYNANKAYNINKAIDEYGTGADQYINDYYTQNPVSKFYFRKDNKNKEYEDAINAATTKQTGELERYLNNNFAGLGGSNTWLNNYWSGNELNDLTNTFIANNYNDALAQLERAKGRGYLSTGGYNSALNNLNNQMSGAKTTVGDIGMGIIDDYKNDLVNKAQGYMTDLSNYNLNKRNSINTTNWANDLANTYDLQKQNLESKFNNATTGLDLFDTADLIGNARINQGVNNNQSDDLYNAIDEQQQRKSKKVGLGNSGLF